MRFYRFCLSLALALALVAAISPADRAHAFPGAVIYGITSDNQIVTFDSSAPQTILSRAAITGLAAGDRVVGIDARPATGQLFALGSSGQLYVIHPSSGAASRVGGPITGLNGANFGLDFNPTVDRIRLTSDAGQNLRLNPNNGALTAVDGALAFAGSDVNAGAVPSIVASAYTNNYAGSTTTTLYNIDSDLNILVTQVPPNNGVLNTVGSLGVNASDLTGFDILGANLAFAVIGGTLYDIDLTTGQATTVGAIGAPVRDIAIGLGVIPTGSVPLCGTLSGQPNSIITTNQGGLYCRVLARDGRFLAPAAQIGNQAIVDLGVIQAVDIFDLTDGVDVSGGIAFCLLGEGRLFYFDAGTSPRTVSELPATQDGLYTCGGVPREGTVVLTRGE
jgi:hypothetical protein